MNTNALKKFAQEARIKLLDQVGAKLEYVLNTDTPELREKADQVRKLREELTKTTKEQLIDKVSYTWFNRFMALRFMDANDYQPIGLRVLTPKKGYTLPELLDEAKSGNIPDELKVKNQRIYDLLDGKIPSLNAQNEAYKVLLIGACNNLNRVFPFLFERINDFTELLLPDDLTSELSIIQDIRDGMTIEDCSEVEIIGWLYQFYISERKDELIEAKKRYREDEIAPVTQLFTPKWIVRYMVENSLVQLWNEARPRTKIIDGLDFFIKNENPESVIKRDIKSPEEITFFDPCVGSAHILCYAFDIFYKIYEEEGYNSVEIPELILSKNLRGVDIDERASQLAGFALMMKGRQYDRRFFKRMVVPNVISFQNSTTNNKFLHAKSIGSLLRCTKEESETIIIDESSLFGEENKHLRKQSEFLSGLYDIVVTNPPYINSNKMGEELKNYVQLNFPEGKADLYSAFLIRLSELTKKSGYFAQMTPFTWMYNSSFIGLRKLMLNEFTIHSLIQPEYHSFYDSAHVPICTYVCQKGAIEKETTFINLDQFKDKDIQGNKASEAVKNKSSNWRFDFNAQKILGIPDSIFAFWLKEEYLELFNTYALLDEYIYPCTGLQTGNNERFIRFWFEISMNNIIDIDANEEKKWAPIAKGGQFRRWYGNYENVINWKNNGEEIKNYKSSVIRNEKFYYQEGITWSRIGVGAFNVRYLPSGFLFDQAGDSMFLKDSSKIYDVLGYLNSNVASEIIMAMSSTMNLTAGSIGQVPYNPLFGNDFGDTAKKCVEITKKDWDFSEHSYNFNTSPILNESVDDIEEAMDYFESKSLKDVNELLILEKQINSKVYNRLGLKDENFISNSGQNVISIRQEYVVSVKKNIDGRIDVSLDFKSILIDFISYFIGIAFGRYSLDKGGLILANQGDSLEIYLSKIGKREIDVSFLPDKDNIIPLLDDEWFEDDITARFYTFLKASFGVPNFDKNLAFVEECLGKDVRKYFVKDFYADHIKRYKKRPIYWMFSSPKGSFNVLIYMHRYTPDTLNNILNDYLIEYREKLKNRIEHLDHLIVSGTSLEQTKAQKEKDRLKLVLIELLEYEREVLRPLAIERIKIDLDEGVLVNYNKFGKAIKEVAGLNDKATKKKVKEFDWINVEGIR